MIKRTCFFNIKLSFWDKANVIFLNIKHCPSVLFSLSHTHHQTLNSKQNTLLSLLFSTYSLFFKEFLPLSLFSLFLILSLRRFPVCCLSSSIPRASLPLRRLSRRHREEVSKLLNSAATANKWRWYVIKLETLAIDFIHTKRWSRRRRVERKQREPRVWENGQEEHDESTLWTGTMMRYFPLYIIQNKSIRIYAATKEREGKEGIIWKNGG